jgi:transformation/transcription domain-associated protein
LLSLAALYPLLNEEDMRCGLWKERSITAETWAGLYMKVHVIPKAQECQWDVLADYGKSVESYEILLDSLWKFPGWAYMKKHVISKAQVEETPKLRLIQAYFALHEKKKKIQIVWVMLRTLWVKGSILL